MKAKHLLLVAITAAATLSSCKKPDVTYHIVLEPVVENSGNTSYRVIQIDNTTYKYDEEGRLSDIEGEGIRFSKAESTIAIGKHDVYKLNSEGYVAYTIDEKGRVIEEYTYDDNGHGVLIEINGDGYHLGNSLPEEGSHHDVYYSLEDSIANTYGIPAIPMRQDCNFDYRLAPFVGAAPASLINSAVKFNGAGSLYKIVSSYDYSIFTICDGHVVCDVEVYEKYYDDYDLLEISIWFKILAWGILLIFLGVCLLIAYGLWRLGRRLVLKARASFPDQPR